MVEFGLALFLSDQRLTKLSGMCKPNEGSRYQDNTKQGMRKYRLVLLEPLYNQRAILIAIISDFGVVKITNFVYRICEGLSLHFIRSRLVRNWEKVMWVILLSIMYALKMTYNI